MRKAYSFRSPQSLQEMRSLLLIVDPNARWRGGDNDFWGSYVTNTPEGEAKIRIFSDGEKYVIDVSSFRSDPAIFERALAAVHGTILPLIRAEEIEPHAGWEG